MFNAFRCLFKALKNRALHAADILLVPLWTWGLVFVVGTLLGIYQGIVSLFVAPEKRDPYDIWNLLPSMPWGWWVVVAAIILLIAAIEGSYRHYMKAAKRIEILEERVRPKLKCSFGQNIPGCFNKDSTIHIITFRGTEQYRESLKSHYCRIKIEANCVGHVQNCSGRLICIKKDGIIIFDRESFHLTFAPAERPNPRFKDVNDKVPEFLDVMALTEENEVLITTPNFTNPSSFDQNKIFSERGNYLLSIVVSSPVTVSIPIDVGLRWTRDWNTSEVYCAS